MTALVDKQQENETDAEPPSPQHGVDPNHQQHRAAGLEQNRQELEQRQNEELQFGEKLYDEHADGGERPERFL